MDTGTLAYVAAVIDTQGIIRLRTVEDIELPMVAVNGPNMPMLQFLGDLTGIKVTVVRREFSRAGCAEHCAEKHQHVTSTSGRWSVSGVKATVLLWNIRPYMRLQVEDATMGISKGLATRYKPSTIERMRVLGWEIPEFDQEWTWRANRRA